MSKLTLDNRQYLTTVCEPFDTPDKILANQLMLFMQRRKALGLAANQVGINKRLFVMNVVSPRRCFNPEILSKGSEVNTSYREGCLSYPKKFTIKPRSLVINVRYMNQNGDTIETIMKNLEAICFQHELDHLNGIEWLE